MPWDESPDKMLQRQAKDQSPFDAEHITGRNRAGIADDPAFIDRPDLFQENNRGTSKGRIAFDEKVRWQTGFLLILACNGSNDQRGRVIVSTIILQNDYRTDSTLLRAGHGIQIGPIDVPTVILPV